MVLNISIYLTAQVLPDFCPLYFQQHNQFCRVLAHLKFTAVFLTNTLTRIMGFPCYLMLELEYKFPGADEAGQFCTVGFTTSDVTRIRVVMKKIQSMLF